MEAIILAGGLGTRLHPRLVDTPKCMASVGGRPFIEFLFDQLAESGFDRIVISVGYLRQVIMESYPKSYKGISISYSIEEQPLGTGGAIRLALSAGMERHALVMNGDSYLDADMRRLVAHHDLSHKSMTMAVTRVEDMKRYGGVALQEDSVSSFLEKGRAGPGWINAGFYVMDRKFPWPEGLPMSFSFENDVLVPNIASLRPGYVKCEGRFIDIGIPEDLDRAQIYLPQRLQ